jgi:hypothetical protein
LPPSEFIEAHNSSVTSIIPPICKS